MPSNTTSRVRVQKARWRIRSFRLAFQSRRTSSSKDKLTKSELPNVKKEANETDASRLFKSKQLLQQLILQLHIDKRLRSYLEVLDMKNSDLELELSKAHNITYSIIKKLREVEQKSSQLHYNMKSICEKLAQLEVENHVLRQQVKTISSNVNGTGFAF